MTWVVLKAIGTAMMLLGVAVSCRRLTQALRLGQIAGGRGGVQVYAIRNDARSFWGTFWFGAAMDALMPLGLLLIVWFA